MATGKLTDLKKAEIVLASFRDERECRSCHLFISKGEAVAWAADLLPLCAKCWYQLRAQDAEYVSSVRAFSQIVHE